MVASDTRTAAAGLPFPDIDPVLIELGPLAIHWYALAYIVGILAGWRLCLRLARRQGNLLTKEQLDDFLLWAVIGIILGGRLGYALVYHLGYYLQNPLDILAVWQGGMAFHGGAAGVAVAIVAFCWRRGAAVLRLADLLAVATPIGLGLGRIANFINAELYGRVTDMPWGVVFPGTDGTPRHPSQLYEAALEGGLLFAILLTLALRTPVLGRPGWLTGAFLMGYGVLRSVGELFRAPDAHIGFLAMGTTMGQLLSIPMIVAGAGLIWWAQRRPAGPAQARGSPHGR